LFFVSAVFPMVAVFMFSFSVVTFRARLGCHHRVCGTGILELLLLF